MYSSFTPPRQVKIGDAAAFAGTTPRAVRHYHQIGLLPEPERGGDGRRRYSELYDAEPDAEPDAESHAASHAEEDTGMSAFEAAAKMPYDFSPARMRCMELTAQLLARDLSDDS